jgi:virulence-associated protein VapD
MQTFILIMLGLFFSTSILFTILYFTLKNKYKKEHLDFVNKFDFLSKSISRLKNELSTKRVGYYQGTVNLMRTSNDKKGDTYTYNIHVKELDRFTNGMSKIELIDIEIISGFSPIQYDYVKKCARDCFSSVRKTSDIEWLESEETTKEQRKQKLDKLKEIESKI